ncbi:hypothetical protein Taro_009038 [Colocasia esculenta]|uniref:CMP/dCMP-type deaminase domain-containing protein n=1 Tax=Colocasia esculenta TaxID=4460 RepID=A0A843U2Y1_COLES|nr:hypothetical protein [Colocasia esculenta]
MVDPSLPPVATTTTTPGSSSGTMYSSSSSVLTVRAKGSLCHHQHHHYHHNHRCCFSGDRVAERCGCCSLGAAHPPCAAVVGFSDRGVLASPGFLYGYLLRHSALIRLAPSRIIVSRGGDAAARYSRLTAAWDGDPGAGGGWRRWRKCGNRRVSSTGAVFDEGFDDMLGLLAEAEECCGEDDGAAADSAAEETYVKEKVGLESHGGSHRRFYYNKIDSSEEEDRKSSSARRSASSFSSISGDSRRNKYFRRRGRDESSGSYNRNDQIAEKEARELQKREEGSRLRRRYHASDSIIADLNNDARKKEEWTGVRDGNTPSRTGSVLQSRERYVQKEQRFTGQEESKEELQKTSHVSQSSVTDRSVVDKKVVNVTTEETSATALLEVVRRQQDEMIQLRKDYQNLHRTTQVQNVSATKTSASCSVNNTRVDNSVENSTVPMGLLEEVQRQRNEIEKLNENYQLLMRAYKMQEAHMIKESNFAKSFGTMLENREENSTSAVNLVEKGTVHLFNMDGQTIDDSTTTSSMLTRTNELEKQHQQLKRLDICESDIRTVTNYGKSVSANLEDRKKKAASTVSLVQELQKHNTNIAQGLQNIGHTNLEATSHNLTDKVDIHNDSGSAESTSKSQRHYMTTIGDQQFGTNSAVKLIEERGEQVSSINEKASGHTDSSRNSEKQTNIVETHKNGATETSRTEDHVKTIAKDQEESSTPLHLVRLSRDKRVQIDQHVTEEINVRNDTQAHINFSVVFRSEADKANATSSDCGKNTASASNLVCEEHLRSEDGRQATQQLILGNDSLQSSPVTSDGGRINLSDSQASSSKMTENEDDYSSLVIVQEAKEKQKACLVEETLGASSGTSESWHTSGTMQAHELDYHTESDRIQLVNADVLESARCQAKSSSHYIGEFVDQLHEEVSASEETDTTSYNSPETQMEVSQPSHSQKSKATTKHEDEVHKKEDTRQYSSRFEVAGPSDEIWDVKGASSQEPSLTEEPEKDSSGIKIPGTADAPPSASGAIIKRSSKSLWSYIAEIVRMGWISRTSSEKSMLKTGAKSSSDESVKSDAWYSGHEPEGDQEKIVKDGHVLTKQSELNKAAVSKPHSRASSISDQVRSEVTRQEDKRMQEDAEMPNPPASTGGSYESDGSPPAPSLKNLVPVDTSKKFEPTLSAVGATSIHSVIATTSTPAVVTTGQSTLLGTTVSSTSEEETETDRVHVAEVGFIKSEEQGTGGISEVVGIEGKDVELKRRKLQRKKQVLREEFEEWEEAYKFESELRKIDEFFMREALLEAKKAADMWEVPVGAVLVQDGKVIARGCNLVEDLRDSTAHAEMICIREASNLLRTWRLAVSHSLYFLNCSVSKGALKFIQIDGFGLRTMGSGLGCLELDL